MGEEKVTADVDEAVANGTVSPTKSNNDVSEKKDGKKEGVEEMCEDTENEVKDKIEEVNVDHKDAEVSKDDKEEEKEVRDSKDDKEEVKEVRDSKDDTEEEKEVRDSEDDTEEEKEVTDSKDDKEEEKEVTDSKDDKEEEKEVTDSKDGKEEEKEVMDSKEEGEDDRKEEAKNDAMEVDDVGNANEERDDKIAEIADMEEAGSKKDATKKTGGEKSKNKKATEEKKKNEEPKTPVGPIIDRPVRERKSVERLVAVIEQDTSKEFHIEKGRGTALKDIPNVAYKLSKKKVVDDTLKLLHTVLFVRRGKALQIKSNILQFSGFVWHENEEKQKTKVHEKLDKLKKEKLFEFCDLLDIPIIRTTAKKEDVIAKLIDFLLVPHATTSEVLGEKEQSSKGNKRKRTNKKSASTSEATPAKDLSKKSKSASEEQKGTPETEDSEEQEDGNSEHHNMNGGPTKSESEEHVSEPESGEEESKKRKRVSKKLPSKKESASKTKSINEATPKKSNPQKKTATESSTIQSKSKDQSESQPPTKIFSRKKKNHVADEKTLTSKKSASKEKTVKKAVKVKETPKEEKLKPSDDELKTAICEILKAVDFNTATFTDILKLLNDRFNTELTPRKATLKSIIKEELTKLADEDDDETGAEKTGKETSTQKT